MSFPEAWIPAVVGMSVAHVDTPALLIDLDVFERNLQRLMRAVPLGPRGEFGHGMVCLRGLMHLVRFADA